MEVSYAWNEEEYFESIQKRVRREYEIAGLARSKGIDPVDSVEIPLAMTMAEKSVGLISTIYPHIPIKEISERMIELEKIYGQLDTTVAFVIAREIAEEKFCSFKNQLEAIDCGIRVGFAYITLGVVSSPIEGYTGIEIGKTRDGKDYFIANFSGPIRSAGTTATCVVLMLIDYLREHFGYAKYDPTEEEVKRYVVENFDYHERVTNLQYLPTEEEIIFLARNLPIQISGDPTEQKEVSNYKDLPRVPTNYIRGGMCLTFSEGLAQKAKKGLGRLKSCKKNGLICTGWDWLSDYLEIHDKREVGGEEVVATYIKDLVAGRPVYGHPGRSGGFRFRYGRSRTSGFSATSIHPATMGITGGFLSHGTQLKIERPTKGCIITSCDSIDGPIVKLKDQSVKRVNDFEESKKLFKEIEEIIYLGDILFPLGDVIDRNSVLIKPGYVPEWWFLELKEKTSVTGEDIDFDYNNLSFEIAKALSEKYSVPLHPNYIYYWTEVSFNQFLSLLRWLERAHFRAGKVILPFEKSQREDYKEAKRALELLGVEHKVFLDNVIIERDSLPFLTNLGVEGISENFSFKEYFSSLIESIKAEKEGEVLDFVNRFSKYEIKDKAGEFIGSRMGRPEKAKIRKLVGSPNTLFPVGEEGGRLRSVQEAVSKGFVKSDWPLFECVNCNNQTIYPLCELCGGKTRKLFYCEDCKKTLYEKCKQHPNCYAYTHRKIDLKKYFDHAKDLLGYEEYELPLLVKGVRGTSSEDHEPENLAKGILRAKFNLTVNKDGTVRYDATEVPITHFKPLEIRTSIKKLKEMGYTKDIFGKELVSEDQILELRPHDVILPSCPDSSDEKADEVFYNIANFVDEELEKIYGLSRYYNLRQKEDLIGHLVVCMAPHNCAGVVGRIIGFSKIQGIIASPFMHAAMRRDCDGDEAAIMLLMDVLLNFSRKFLPSHRGGTQDAPLVLNARIRAGEVDDQILAFETCSFYPLEVYRLAEQKRHSSECKIETVKQRLKEGKSPFSRIGFTHDSIDINLGYLNGAYKSLPTMKEKVEKQMDLVEKIRAVDAGDVARLVIERHFIRDIRGNLRKFSQQQFRCVKCNEKFRRPPLIGVCMKCGGRIIFTISEGSIRKYLEPALHLANKYKIPDYTREGIELAKIYIESIFGKESEKQEALNKWF